MGINAALCILQYRRRHDGRPLFLAAPPGWERWLVPREENRRPMSQAAWVGNGQPSWHAVVARSQGMCPHEEAVWVNTNEDVQQEMLDRRCQIYMATAHVPARSEREQYRARGSQESAQWWQARRRWS